MLHSCVTHLLASKILIVSLSWYLYLATASLNSELVPAAKNKHALGCVSRIVPTMGDKASARSCPRKVTAIMELADITHLEARGSRLESSLSDALLPRLSERAAVK